MKEEQEEQARWELRRPGDDMLASGRKSDLASAPSADVTPANAAHFISNLTVPEAPSRGDQGRRFELACGGGIDGDRSGLLCIFAQRLNW
jgi:hypothetical protein